uniref:Uncharacterized protein n=1 Tax=viral metagenome TaxID=1070528 RepID=A0A2V0RC86_9ZZZZ
MPKRKLQQRNPAFVGSPGMRPGGTNMPNSPAPRRTGGRAGNSNIQDNDFDVVGDIDQFGNVERQGPPSPRPTQKPIVQKGAEVVGNIARDAITSPQGQDMMNQVASQAGKMAAEAAGNAAVAAGSRAKQAIDNRRRRKQPQPQAGGGNNNNRPTGGNNMRPGRGNGNGGNGSRRGGGAGGQAFEPMDSWNSGMQSGPFAAAPAGPRVFIQTPDDSTLDKIASVPQQFFDAGDTGKYGNQQIRTQINVINWNDSYQFGLKNAATGSLIQDTVNQVIQNVWVDKYSAIIQDAIAYKRGTNSDINNTLTFDKITFYHNVGARCHALLAEINARRNFLPDYPEQNQALSSLKSKLDTDTSLLSSVEELKFKMSNLVLPPDVMAYCCWMFQLNKTIPETGSDVSLAMSHYMNKDLLDVDSNSFKHTKKEIDELLTLLSSATATAPALTVVEFQVITQYLRNTRFPYQLMGNHVFGHPKMDYDPVWNGMWDNMAIYANDNTLGRINLFGEYSDSDQLQVAFPLSPNNVPIATTAPLIMNFGKFGTDNDTDMKRSAFPYWGLSVPENTYEQTYNNNSNKWVLELDASYPKGIKTSNTIGSATLLTPHIFNFGASSIISYEFNEYNNNGATFNYLKQRGENTYQYKPSKLSTQDAVKRFFIQMEGMQSVIPLSLRD